MGAPTKRQRVLVVGAGTVDEAAGMCEKPADSIGHQEGDEHEVPKRLQMLECCQAFTDVTLPEGEK